MEGEADEKQQENLVKYIHFAYEMMHFKKNATK